MKLGALITITLFASASLAYAAENIPAKEPTAATSTDKPISQEIKELSNKEIFGKYKKNIVPVKIKEKKSSEEDNISIIYDSPRKPLPAPGSNSKSSLGFKVQDKDPNDISSMVTLGYKAALLGESEASLTLYKQALAQDPSNTNILFALASLYHKLHQYKEAKLNYKKLLSIDPDYKKALNNYLVLMAEESPTQALTELRELEKENPDFSPIQAQIGMIFAQIGEYNEAERYFRRAISLSPEILSYRYNLGVVYDTTKRYPEAVALYKQVVTASGTAEPLPQSVNSIRNRMLYLQEKIAVHQP